MKINKTYKAFNEDWTCRGFQYEVGKTYEHDGEIEVCQAGFHGCENPFDLLNYYDLIGSKFAEVNFTGETKGQKQDSKIVGGKITIDAELHMSKFVKACVDWIVDHTRGKSDIWDSARIGSSGDYARIGSSGYYAQIGSSGYYARIGSSGVSAQIGSSGYSAQIGSSGDSAQIGSSGDYAQIDTFGGDSVTASAGVNTRWRGKDGAWASLAEYKDGKCVGFATGCVGRDGLKPDTWYKAKGGKLVEVNQK